MLVAALGAARSRTGLVLAAVAGACLLRGPEPFIWDARLYWGASVTVASGGAVPLEDPAFYSVRGALSGVTFLPAALLSRVAGGQFAGTAVLLQNALLIGVVAAVLVPALARPWRALDPPRRWLAAGLTWAALQGFAPYPLMDLYATAAVLGAVALLGGPGRPGAPPRAGSLVGAGLLLGYGFAVRPALLPVAVLLLLVTAASERSRAALALGGFAAALLPQVVRTATDAGRFSLLPDAAGAVAALQTRYGAYVVRYDTVPTRAQPSQFFCSPGMAEHVGTPPGTTTDLLLLLLRHPADSAPFVLQKVATALHWPLAVPYADPHPGADALVAVGTTALVLLGCGHLIAAAWARRHDPAGPRWAGLRVLAVLAGTLAVLAASAPEPRFALPLVVLGVAGVAAAAGSRPAGSAHRVRAWAAAALVVAVVALGWSGLAHPAPPGLASPAACAAA
ncbi:MAG: hypothetical protein ABW025_03690 [Cellulomonas sp.]